jgi:hypothetical protein
MPRAVRERPLRTSVAIGTIIAVLALGWAAGAGTAGSAAPRLQLTPGESVATKTVVQTQTVTVAAGRGASRASGRRITRRPEANKQHRR